MINNIKSSSHYEDVVKILGKQFIKSDITNSFDFITIANKGVNAQVIQNFRKHFNLSRETMAHLMHVSEPTIYRWLKQNKMLDRNSSIKLLELTDVFLFGIEVFDSSDNFFQWIEIPNAALGGLKPLELLEIPGGISKVRNLLGRIEYGVFS